MQYKLISLAFGKNQKLTVRKRGAEGSLRVVKRPVASKCSVMRQKLAPRVRYRLWLACRFRRQWTGQQAGGWRSIPIGEGDGLRAWCHREIENVTADSGERGLVTAVANAELNPRKSELSRVRESWNITPINFSVATAIKGNLSPMWWKTLDKHNARNLRIENHLRLRRQDLSHSIDEPLFEW